MHGIHNPIAIQEGIRAPTKTNNCTTRTGQDIGVVPRTSGTICLGLDLMTLNQALIRSSHRGSTINDFCPRLKNVQYPMLSDTSPGYHNLKLDKKHHF